MCNGCDDMAALQRSRDYWAAEAANTSSKLQQLANRAAKAEDALSSALALIKRLNKLALNESMDANERLRLRNEIDNYSLCQVVDYKCKLVDPSGFDKTAHQLVCDKQMYAVHQMLIRLVRELPTIDWTSVNGPEDILNRVCSYVRKLESHAGTNGVAQETQHAS